MTPSATPDVECAQHHPTLSVIDVLAATAFYTTKLGFTLAFTWGEPPEIAGVNLGRVQVFLEQGTPNPGGCSVYFVVGDADELYGFQRANGVDIVEPPGDLQGPMADRGFLISCGIAPGYAMEHHTMRMITTWCGLLAVGLIMPCLTVSALNREQVTTQNLLTRWYEMGERVSYRMTGTNKDRSGTTSYAATATGVVKTDDTGRFFEEFEWSALVWNGMPFQIPPTNPQFRQRLSLSPDSIPAIPDLSPVHPRLIGPALVLRSFYADAWSAMQQSTLRFSGNRAVVFNRGDTNSWADGVRVILGEDSTDLEITLDNVNVNEGTATLTVVHVPPAQPKIRIPAEWMRTRVAADVPNNWIQVVRGGARQFVASIGKETLQVELQLSLTNGKIFSARMENPVEVFERECTDEALTMCGEGIRYQILRQIAIAEGP